MRVVIHVTDADLARALTSYVERRLRFALSRFRGRVGPVTVRMSADGPAKSRCRIEAELLPFGHVESKKSTPICSRPLIVLREGSVGCWAVIWSESVTPEWVVNQFARRRSRRAVPQSSSEQLPQNSRRTNGCERENPHY